MNVKSIPTHRGAPILGSLTDFRADQLGFLERMHRTYGDVVRYPLLTASIVQLNHPDLIQMVLVSQANQFTKGDLDHTVFSRSTGNGLLVSEGEVHKKQRKLMQPAFHHKRIESYGQTTTSLTASMMDMWRDGQTLDMHEAMTKLTLFIVSKVLYDADVSAQAGGVGHAVHVINHESEEMYKQGFALPEWLPTPQNRAVRHAVQDVNAVMVPIIEARRRSGEDHGDLLSMLLAAQDEETGAGMSDQQVRDEAVSLFIAGHETTSNALAWTWFLLSQHPAAEARLHEELDTVLAGRLPTTADLPTLKFTDWVIKESMRLYPPAWILNGRTPLADVSLGGYEVRKGEVIFMSQWVMHRDSRYFNMPEAFMPERWANDFEKSIPRYAYFPFGGGPRVCIGNSFAMMEARLVLATIAQQFRVALAPGAQVTPEPLITLRPKHGIPAVLHRRQPALAPTFSAVQAI